MNITRAFKLLSLLKGIVKSDFESVAGIMGEMHGLTQKLGQHFTLYPGHSYREYFDSLCINSREEDVHLEEILADLDIHYKKAELHAQASIGQVYKVETEDGLLAVKVRYPNLEKRIKSDFAVLRALFWPLRLTPLRNNSLILLIDKLHSLLLRECDYREEAGIQESFSRLFAGDDTIMVSSIKTYNERAIVSDWVEGKNLIEAEELPGAWFVGAYLRFTLQSLKQLGTIHADPHPGNFMIISADPRLNKASRLAILDFGSVVCFTPLECEAVIRLLSGGYNDEAELVNDLIILGVSDEVLTAYEPIIGDLVSILLEPFYYPGEYDFMNWRLQYKMNTLMASRSWQKPFDLPLKLLLLLRTLHGLYYYARINFVRLNWNEAVTNYTR